jgi:hypothetical protein
MPSTTITYSASDGQRIAAAVGHRLGLQDGQGAPRAATGTEVKAYLADILQALVLHEERQAALEAAEAALAPTVVLT